MERYQVVGHLRLSPEGTVTSYADAQATVEALQAQLEAAERHKTILQDANKVALEKVEALQRERDEAIEAASLPTWVCDGCGRVSSEGWINRVTESLDGTDYEMECPVCGVRAIEEDCASDLVGERDDLQAALDAEREKVKGLHEITKVICTHCCEPMEIPSKAVLQTQLTQLQALVWDVLRTFDYLTFHRVAGMDVLLYESHNRTSPERTVEATARRIRATLNATTPAPMGSNILEEDIGKAMMRSKGGDGE